MNSFYPALPIMQLDKGLPMPSYAHEGDAGLDLYATQDLTIKPGDTRSMGSGIAVAIPAGFAGFVLPRSGLGTTGLVIKNGTGVIDSGYRGEIRLTFLNNNKSRICRIKRGERVAQLVLVAVASAVPYVVDELDDTERGTGGFGSTGA